MTADLGNGSFDGAWLAQNFENLKPEKAIWEKYAMTIDNPAGDPDCHKPAFSVQFEPRRVEDLRQDEPQAAFERVKQMSEFNETLYRTYVSPWVRALASPASAQVLKWLHPMRTSRYLLSETFNPWMLGISMLGGPLVESRHPLSNDQPFMAGEREVIEGVTRSLEAIRQRRDAGCERMFGLLFRRPFDAGSKSAP